MKHEFENPRLLLAKYGIQAKKSWGQNFLVDRNAHSRIAAAAAITPGDVVIEIGAGLGTLTAVLADATTPPGRVIAVECEPQMLQVLGEQMAALSQVEVCACDATQFDLVAAAHNAGRPVVVVGNLPYQITSPLVFGIIKAGAAVARAVLMVQREFAERLAAPPGSKSYGRLSVMAQQSAEAKILFHVSPSAFHPRPSVMSSVMRLIPRTTPLAPMRDPALFDRLVRAAFEQRRKMLRRALAPAFGEAVLGPAFAASDINGERRAETLSVAEFARLSDALGAELQRA